MDNAYVSGGIITRRWIHLDGFPKVQFHESAQGVIAYDGNISDPESFVIMDGGKSLPFKYFKDHLSDNNLRAMYMRESCSYSIEGDVIYLPGAHEHFGHFLIEFLPRLWFIDKLSDSFIRGSTFLIPVGFRKSWMNRFLDPILKFCVPKRTVFLEDEAIVRCEKLWTPSLSYMSHQGYTSLASSNFDLLTSIYEKSIDPSDKTLNLDLGRVFLSRSLANRSCTNINYVESLYEKKGFLILYPETLSVDDQLYISQNTVMAAGFVGSATYLMLFSKKLEHMAVIAPQNFMLPDDYLIACIRNYRLSIMCGSKISFERGSNSGDWWVGESETARFLESYLDVNQ
jgi:capsular polysaccharide biosynthesis protein